MKRRTTVLAAATVVGALSVPVPAQAADEGITLVRTGDVDVLEDVFEHISMPTGDGGRTVHQMYGVPRAAVDGD